MAHTMSINTSIKATILPDAVETKRKSGAGPGKRPWRIGFFTVMPGVILLLVVAGFTRTLFARPVFHPAPIPPYLYVHGIVLTCWFVWAWAQALLVSAGRIADHRRWGAVGAGFAVAVFAAALMASFGSVSRKPFDLDAPASIMGTGLTGITVAQFRSSVVWGNLANAVSFALFVAGAVIYRRRPQIHKRFMLLASISIVEPALARMARWPGFGGEQGPFIPVVVWSLVAALAVYDVVTRKRLETCTAIAIVWLLIVRNGAVWVADTHLGLGLIYALR
jgi:hypothetical protein